MVLYAIWQPTLVFTFYLNLNTFTELSWLVLTTQSELTAHRSLLSNSHGKSGRFSLKVRLYRKTDVCLTPKFPKLLQLYLFMVSLVPSVFNSS